MIDGIQNTGAPGPLGPKPVDPSKPVDIERSSDAEQAAPGKPRQDTAKISESSAEIARYQEMAKLHREAYGDEDRTKKLEEVRNKIKQRFYDKPEVMEKVAGGIARAVQGAADESDVERAQRRSEEGFYDRPEVIDKTAENIVKEILPGIQREAGRE